VVDFTRGNKTVLRRHLLETCVYAVRLGALFKSKEVAAEAALTGVSLEE